MARDDRDAPADGRSRRWAAELDALRPVLLASGLTEERKWGKPCFTHAGRNIAIAQEMKDFLALMFFKGALIDDTTGALEEQGENTRSARRICFRSVDDVTRLAAAIRVFVAQAIAVEDAGLAVAPAAELVLCAEMQERLDADPALAAAFAALTPGRRREYHLYVSGAKQSATRRSRVESCVDRILVGKGLRDR